MSCARTMYISAHVAPSQLAAILTLADSHFSRSLRYTFIRTISLAAAPDPVHASGLRTVEGLVI